MIQENIITQRENIDQEGSIHDDAQSVILENKENINKNRKRQNMQNDSKKAIKKRSDGFTFRIGGNGRCTPRRIANKWKRSTRVRKKPAWMKDYVEDIEI